MGLSSEAMRAATQFGQRPRLVPFAEHALPVLFGATEGAGGGAQMVEVHFLIGAGHLVTLRRGQLPARESLRATDDARPIVESAIGAVIDSLLAAVEAIDDEIDLLEDEIITRLDESLMQRVTDLRRSLVDLRHVGAAPARPLRASCR